jgi:hypothetical protein
LMLTAYRSKITSQKHQKKRTVWILRKLTF